MALTVSVVSRGMRNDPDPRLHPAAQNQPIQIQAQAHAHSDRATMCWAVVPVASTRRVCTGT